MRSPRRARWPICAVALSLVAVSTSVLADSKSSGKKSPKRTIAACTSFDQLDRADEDGVDFSITSSCDVTLACGIKWKLTCAPESKKRKTFREAAAFSLPTGTSAGVTASASRCGHDGWEIGEITWSCEPVADQGAE